MQELVCKKCGYVWRYTGNKRRISCSKCKTSITINPDKDKDKQKPKPATTARRTEIPPATTTAKPIPIPTATETALPQQAKFRVSLYFDKRLEQMLFHCRSMGDNYITLKVDKDGFLSLPT